LKRRIILVLLLVSVVLLLSGCVYNAQTISELKEGNFFFSSFVYPLALLLTWLHDHLWNQYGLAILAITIIVRLLVLPLAIKQYKSMKGMQKIQPQMKELREKYKDDPKTMQTEVMKLMQEHGVNPAAGCLPLFIQMPILFALYYAINTTEVVGDKAAGIPGETFLWFELGARDTTYILPLLAAITTVIPMMMTKNDSAPPQMKIMYFVFPIMIFFISQPLPAALPLYWFYSNIFSIIQTYFIYRDTQPIASTSSTNTLTTAPVVEKVKKKRRKK
jgi:YidC/Oxa1 family membrane protein insertase